MTPTFRFDAYGRAGQEISRTDKLGPEKRKGSDTGFRNGFAARLEVTESKKDKHMETMDAKGEINQQVLELHKQLEAVRERFWSHRRSQRRQTRCT